MPSLEPFCCFSAAAGERRPWREPASRWHRPAVQVRLCSFRLGTAPLTQAEFTLVLESGDLQIQITPLAESVIRLAAPDTYQRLASLAASASSSLGSRAPEESSLFLVSMFSRAPTIAYEPENLHIVNSGLRYRPIAIQAITPGWGGQRLRQEETQIAVYAFDVGIDLEIALMVEYEGASDTSWDNILRELELERARVRGRIRS